MTNFARVTLVENEPLRITHCSSFWLTSQVLTLAHVICHIKWVKEHWLSRHQILDPDTFASSQSLPDQSVGTNSLQSQEAGYAPPNTGWYFNHFQKKKDLLTACPGINNYLANMGTPAAIDASQIPRHMRDMVPTTLARRTVMKMATPFFTPRRSWMALTSRSK